MINEFDRTHGISEHEQRHREMEIDELHLAAAILDTEPYACKHFGCGHILTPQEQLYGSRCINHQETVKLTHEINKVL